MLQKTLNLPVPQSYFVAYHHLHYLKCSPHRSVQFLHYLTQVVCPHHPV